MHNEQYVFHLCTPGNAEADQLLPLSALQHTHPSVFADAIAKYDDTPERRQLPETWIPILEARWIDAVFLSPVHPHAIWSAWQEITGQELPPQEFWAIPINAVTRPVLFDRRHSRTGEPIDPVDVANLDPRTYRTANHTTSANTAWLAHLAAHHQRGAWFNGVPHVLTTEPVSLDMARIIDWSTS